jgi:serine/threonine-protein kinase
VEPDDVTRTPEESQDETADLAPGSPPIVRPAAPNTGTPVTGDEPTRVPGDTAPVPWVDLVPGATVGGLQVEAVIGRGGFGAVYRAVAADGTAVALKVLHAEVALARENVARFEREMTLVAMLEHANTPRLLDVGRLADGRPYYTMELLAGETLSARVARSGPLTLAELLAVVGPLCAILGQAHARGVVHRDIKPSNVMLADRVVLLDFGIAKLLDDSGPSLTRSRQVIGSPVALSPEQITGAPVDTRTDVYGLGVLAYFALSGSYPFSHDDLVVLEQLHLEREPRRLTERVRVPAAAAAVIHRALAKAPERRPRDANAFWAALRSACSDDPVVAVRVELTTRHPSDQLSDDDLDRLEEILPGVITQLGAAGLSLASRGQDDALLIGATPDRLDELTAVARGLLSVGAPLADLSFTFRVGPADAVHDSSTWPPAIANDVAVLTS